MKKILSFVLVLAMVLSCVSMVTFASEGAVTGFKASMSAGGTKTLVSSSVGNANMVESEEVDGDTSYYILFKIRVYNLSNGNISFGPQASSGGWNDTITTVYDHAGGNVRNQTVTAHGYADFSMKIPVILDGTTYKTVGSSGTAKALTGLQIRWDFGSGAANVEGSALVFEALSPAAQLYCASANVKDVYCFTIEKLTITDYPTYTDTPVVGGDYIHVTDRINENATANYDLLDEIKELGAGTYLISGYFRFPDAAEDATNKINFIVRYGLSGSTKYDWATGNQTISGNGWQVFSKTKTFTEDDINNLTSAVLGIVAQDGSGVATKANIEMDAFQVRKLNDDNTSSDNLINDPDCTLGPDTGWYKSNCTISNPVAVPTSFTVVTDNAKTVYNVGDELDTTGLALNVTYSNGATATVTEGFEVTGFNSATAGEKELTVTYGDLTAKYTVSVIKNATGITVNADNVKKTYKINEVEQLDTTGLVVTLNYNDGSSEPVTEYTVSGFNPAQAGEQTITVTYGDYTDTFTVTVEAPKTVGVKFTTTVAQPANGYDLITWGNNLWGANNSFEGTIAAKYVVYNTSGKQLKFVIVFTELDKGKDGQSGTTQRAEVVIPAGKKAVVSLSTDFVDGYTTIKDKTDVALNRLTLRIYPTFTGGDIGDSFVVAPFDGNSEDPMITKFTDGDVTKEALTDLPEGYSFFATGLSVDTTKTQYANGEDLDKSSLTVTATMSDGTTSVVNDYTVSGYDKTTAGTQTVTVTYEGVSATFDVTVAKPDYKAVNLTCTDASAPRFMTAYGVFEQDDDFSGTKWAAFEIYNYSSQPIKVSLWVEKNWSRANTSTNPQFYIPAYGKRVVACSVVFENGKATNYKNEEYNMNEYLVRFDFNLTSVGAQYSIVNLATDDVIDDVFFNTPTDKYHHEYSLTTVQPVATENPAMKVTVIQDTGTALRYARLGDISVTPFDVIEKDGEYYLELSYTVYNMNSIEKYVIMNAYNTKNSGGNMGWSTTATGGVEKCIQPYSSATWTIKVPVVKDANGNYAYWDEAFQEYHAINTLAIRFDKKNTRTWNNGDVFYVQANNALSGTYLNVGDSNYFTFDDTTFTAKDVTTINGAAPEIGASTAFNIVVTPDLKYVNGARLKVTRQNADGPVVTYLNPIDVATISGIQYKKEWGTLVFKYTGINAQCMGDEITFELVYGEDTIASVDNYSVVQYAINTFGKTATDLDLADDKFTQLKTLLSDMLVYGAEAQKSIGYKTDALVTDVIATAGVTLTPSANYAKPEYSATISDGNTLIASATLNISHVNRVRFTLADASKVTSVTINGVDAKIDGNYVYSEDILITELDKVFTIVVTDGENTATVTYCANDYINKKTDSTKATGTTTIGAVCQALNNYGQSAVAYKG